MFSYLVLPFEMVFIIRDNMSSFLNVMNVIMNGFNQSFTVYGFTLSFWDIWLWSIIGAIVAAFIGGMLK